MAKNDVGNKIKKRRNELNLTQKDLADYVGVTEATVSRWESGDINNMRIDKITKLSEALQVSPLFIMDTKYSELNDLAINDEEAVLVLTYRKLDDKVKEFLKESLKNVIRNKKLSTLTTTGMNRKVKLTGMA